MMKKLVSLLLAVIMICALIPAFTVPASAAGGKYAGKIDYSRLLQKVDDNRTVTLSFGNVTVRGKLKHLISFDQETIDLYVDLTLQELGITADDVAKAHKDADAALSANDFSRSDYERILKDWKNMFAPVPGSSYVIDAMDYYFGYRTKSEAQLVAGYSKEYAKKQASELLLGKAASGFASKVTNYFKAAWAAVSGMSRSYTENKEKWKKIADGAIANRLLMTFYDTCNAKLNLARAESNESGYMIDFNGASGTGEFTFYGVGGNTETWAINGVLFQEFAQKDGNVWGTYSGQLSANCVYDLSGSMGAGLPAAASNMPLLSEGLSKVDGVALQAAAIATGTRKISGNAEVTINVRGSGTLSVSGSDNKEASITGGALALTKSTPLGMAKGTLTINGSHAGLNVKCTGLDLPGYDAGEGSGGVPFDANIWKSWDGEKIVEVSGK